MDKSHMVDLDNELVTAQAFMSHVRHIFQHHLEPSQNKQVQLAVGLTDIELAVLNAFSCMVASHLLEDLLK